MDRNVISTLASRLHRAFGPRISRSVGLGVLLGSASLFGGCASMDAYSCEVARPVSCGLDGGACDCAAPVCAAPLPDCPPSARPGETWCRVLIPARYETISEEIETVCPSVQHEWVPPLMETRVIPVLLTPACTDVIRTPGATRVDEMCTEICPPRTETRAVVHTDACGCTTTTCETVCVPAVKGTCTREVCIQAPATRFVCIPEQVSARTCEVEVRPGYWRETAIPGVRERRSRLVCRTPERWEWQRNPSCAPPVACPTTPCAPAGAGAAR